MVQDQGRLKKALLTVTELKVELLFYLKFYSISYGE
jgi:hypothetical protein